MRHTCMNQDSPFQWRRERDYTLADRASEQRGVHRGVHDVDVPGRHEHRALPLARRLQPRHLPRGQEGQQREGAAHKVRYNTGRATHRRVVNLLTCHKLPIYF